MKKVNNTKPRKAAISITLFIVIGIFAALILSKVSFDKSVQVQKAASEEVIDSIITKKVDYRFTSYDHKFIYTNTVVVDAQGEIIGKLIIQTNEKEIDSFYNKSHLFKTRTYDNLKTGNLKILDNDVFNDEVNN